MKFALRRAASAAAGAMWLAACVPEGPATIDGGPAPIAAKPVALPRVLGEGTDAASAAPITEVFRDDFERAALGPAWLTLSSAWKIQAGRLCVKGARNRGAWLRHALPMNARIEFDATSDSPEGDIKVELWGDGKSGATGASYTNATSYLAVLGGWKNTKHVLARLDEHGADRLELEVDPLADDERLRAVEPGQPYHFQIQRTDGKTVEVSVNGQSYFRFVDPAPLVGEGHDRLGFNDWDASVCFDDLEVTPL